MSKLIQFGQKNSFYGNPPEYSWWNHACLVVTKDGDMMEALLTGVQLSHIRRYEERAYKVVHLNLNELDRRQILHFAHSVAQARTRYGVLTIASIVLTLLGGTQLVFGKAGTAICSGFVCEALCRAGFNFPKAPSHMMPGDLAQMFAVQGGG